MLALSASLAAQSLGELAQKTAADREKTKVAAPATNSTDDKSKPKTFTNQDLSGGSVSDQPAVTGVQTPEAVKTGTEAKTSAEPSRAATQDAPKGEAYWRDRAKAIDQQRDADVALLNAAVRHMDGLAHELQPSQVSILTTVPDLHAAEAEVYRLRAVVQHDNQLRADLDEEARRAGALPGWLRWR